DDDSLEHLDTRTVTLDDVHVHLDSVTGTELGNVALERRGIDVVELLHFSLSLRPPQVGTRNIVIQDWVCIHGPCETLAAASRRGTSLYYAIARGVIASALAPWAPVEFARAHFFKHDVRPAALAWRALELVDPVALVSVLESAPIRFAFQSIDRHHLSNADADFEQVCPVVPERFEHRAVE